MLLLGRRVRLPDHSRAVGDLCLYHAQATTLRQKSGAWIAQPEHSRLIHPDRSIIGCRDQLPLSGWTGARKLCGRRIQPPIQLSNRTGSISAMRIIRAQSQRATQ